MENMRTRAAAGISQGDTFTISRTFSTEETEAFGALTRDYNPVHHDERFARARGLPGVIMHGLLAGGMITEIGGQVGCLASSMNFEFVRPVFAGDTVTCVLTFEEVDEAGRKARASAMMRNQHGELVARGGFKGLLPVGEERRELARMIEEGDPTNRVG